MSYDREQAVLNKVLDSGDFKTLIRSKVTHKFFNTVQTREVFDYISKAYASHGVVPSVDVVQDEFPEFPFYKVSDALPFLVERLREQVIYGDIQERLKKVAEATKGDPASGLRLWQEAAVDLSGAHALSEALDATQTLDEVEARYQQIEEGGGLLGIPTPWDALTRMTGGWQKGRVYGFYGRTGTMKTWLAIYCASFIHEQYGKVPLFLSKELPKEDIQWRWVAMRAKVDYSALNEGRLTGPEKKRFKLAVEELRDSPPFIVDLIENTGKSAVLEVRAKIEEQEPDMVFLDGVYFMADDPSNWGQMAIINNSIKQQAMSFKLPFLITTQRNYDNKKKGSGESNEVDDVGYGKSFAQAVDFLIRIVREGTQIENEELMIVVPKARESKGKTFIINAKLGGNLSQKYVQDDEPAIAGGPEDNDDLLGT